VLWCDEQAMLALNSTGGFSPENYIMWLTQQQYFIYLL
jgi:hypothetical protein